MLVRAMAGIAATAALVLALVVAPAAPVSAADDSIVRCLVRSAIVPVDADAAATDAEARDAALRSLRHALLVADPDGLAAAELRLDDTGLDGTGLDGTGLDDTGPDSTGLATGLDVLEASPGAAAAAAPLAIASLPERLRQLVDEGDTLAVGTAPASLRALCDGLDRALDATGQVADALVSAAIDHRRGSLRLGVEPESRAAAIARPGALPTAASGADPVPAPALRDALGLGPLPLEVVADLRDAPTSRLDDRDGIGGGVALRVGTAACTSGFAVRMRDGGRAVMGAGHCTAPDGTNGATVVNGFQSSLCGSSGSGAMIGRVSDNLLTTGWAVDSMVVRTAAAAPTMWLGARCSGTREVPVQGIGTVAAGARVGFSGTRRGEQYGTRTTEPAGCYDFGFWSCSVHRAMSSSSGYICLPGDSGGPAFRHRADGGVQALGVISASGYDLGINRCSYVDAATALWLTGATIVTQASTAMQAPARIAGADRWETAARVAAHGYPAGAREVYVVSGELFSDALSAGAAAAHVGAPLLLTAGRSLPAATRAALERLAPTSIVLVGGPATVSMEVEDQLAALAPVTRIAGSNRYDTSVLVSRHAFGTAAHAFVATGRTFPDALAAGPVAALRGAPMLLVDGLGAATPDLLGELDELGATRVTVVGGPASVRQPVVDAVGAGRAVTRVGGSDRYAVAVALSAAFPPGPRQLFIASGEVFTDALAASAVAGAMRVPLVLSQRTCLSGVIPPEHARLGRPPVVLLGGTSTLSPAVARYELCG